MSLTAPSPIDAANEQALQRIYAARPYLVAVHPARALLPQLGSDTILHAGPPVAWEAMCGPMHGAVVGVCSMKAGRLTSRAPRPSSCLAGYVCSPAIT